VTESSALGNKLVERWADVRNYSSAHPPQTASFGKFFGKYGPETMGRDGIARPPELAQRAKIRAQPSPIIQPQCALGAGGRRFESGRPDLESACKTTLFKVARLLGQGLRSHVWQLFWQVN
jgi:hypothetical protein